VTNADKGTFLMGAFSVLIRTMLTIPKTEPSTITAGDTLTWSRSLPDYPATSGWALNYSLLSLAGSTQIGSAADGADHLIKVLPEVSSTYVPGTYNWQAWVTDGVDRIQISRGTIEILPDYAATGTGALDTRSHVKKVLDAIEAVIEGRAGKGDQELTIDGTRLVKMTAAELLDLRFRYKAEYKLELQKVRIAQGKNSGRKIVTRFTR
jgi:hypothetical protein